MFCQDLERKRLALRHTKSMVTPFIEFINKRLKNDLVGVEIGVRSGANAVSMLDNMKIKKLYLVDNFLEYTDNQNEFYSQLIQDTLYQTLLVLTQVVKTYEGKTEILKEDSEKAINRFRDEYFDFVYIDGAHDYENVKKDLEWIKKVKVGGYIGGHDYDVGSPEVIQAVDEFITKNEYELNALAQRPGDNNGVEWAVLKTI